MNEELRKIVERTSASDYDGHTAFSQMTHDQRLSWLDAANAAYRELYALARPELRVAEEPPKYGTEPE